MNIEPSTEPGRPHQVPAITAADLNRLGVRIKTLQHLLRAHADGALAPIGANLAVWSVLRGIRADPGASSSDLAREAFLTPQTIGGLLARMAGQGLIGRQPGHGRVVHTALTPAGEDMLDACDARVAAVMSRLTERFTPNRLAAFAEMIDDTISTFADPA